MLSKSSELSRDVLEFYQRRVSLFGLIGASLGFTFLVYRLAMAILGPYLEELRSPSFWLHVAAVVPLVAVWLLCRGAPRTERFVRVVEMAGFAMSCAAYVAMGTTIPPVAHPHMIVLMALTTALVGRAIFVPSSARATLLLGAIIAVPYVVGTYTMYDGMDSSRLGVLGVPDKAGFVLFMTVGAFVWWSMSTALATATSHVVHGLRKEVRDIRRLGQYALEEKIGEGAMGAVYRASHAMLRRPTAVKLLPPDKAGEATIQRFEREVQLTARLTHPNTITVFDYGRTPEGVFYYAMELLDGATLEDVVELDGPQPAPRIVQILVDAAGALAEAHGIGLIHRDIKPANLILCEQGGKPDVAKVVDFGLVKEIERGESPALTAANSITGTPLYMAPESIVSPGEVDARSDIYALGAVGYYLLTGEHVFGGSTLVEVCSHHLHTPPVPPSERLGADVPDAIEQIILECLCKDPADRPQSARALRDRLSECREPDRWTEDDANRWWEEHRGALKDLRKRRADSTSAQTLAVDMATRK